MVQPALWNRLGSSQEVRNSTLGPDGIYLGGGSFGTGKFGGAFYADSNADSRVAMPKLGTINPEAGAIEFWAKIEGFGDYIDWDGHPNFIEDLGSRDRVYWETYMGFNGNNGTAGGGLAGEVSGNGAGTGSWEQNWYYEQILSEDPDGWHHYAIVWDADGIAGVNDGQRVFAIYLDGQLNSHQWDVYQPADLHGVTVEDSYLGLLNNTGGQGTAAIDNLKIWDFAKTDFSDRFVEGLTYTGTAGSDSLT